MTHMLLYLIRSIHFYTSHKRNEPMITMNWNQIFQFWWTKKVQNMKNNIIVTLIAKNEKDFHRSGTQLTKRKSQYNTKFKIWEEKLANFMFFLTVFAKTNKALYILYYYAQYSCT